MLINVTLVGERETLAKIKGLAPAVDQALYLKIKVLSLKLEKHIKTNKLNGQVLNRITGALARSIHSTVDRTRNAVMGKVFSSGDVKYARIHEYGGTIQHPGGTAYIIDPKKRGLAMFISNKAATPDMKRTQPHPIKMPERSYMRTGLRDMSTEISTGMKKSVIDTIRKRIET